MTTPGPRVRVESASPDYPGCYQWRCEGCGLRSGMVYIVLDGRVQTHAREHAATCPALRLARLLHELEALRDRWIETAIAERRNAYGVTDPFGLAGYANGIESAADDLTAILARAGGTGC